MQNGVPAILSQIQSVDSLWGIGDVFIPTGFCHKKDTAFLSQKLQQTLIEDKILVQLCFAV